MSFLFLRYSRLERVDERTTIYQMAHCVFLFLGSLTLLNIEMRYQLGFSGRKSVKFLGLTVLPICHLLYWTICAVSDGKTVMKSHLKEAI